MVGRINNKEGDGSKSEKLAGTGNLYNDIIVTIQTFPFVLRAIENSTNLKQRRYAVIAMKRILHQSGSTARQLKEVLMLEERDEDAELSSEDILDAVVWLRKGSNNLSYYAFTATPKRQNPATVWPCTQS